MFEIVVIFHWVKFRGSSLLKVHPAMQQTTDTNSASQEQRKLAAIMFADMMGYTALMQEDEAGAKLLRNRQKKTLETLIPEHNGTIIQFFGDGTLSMFDSSADAVRCGIAIQHELQKEPSVKLRIGIHSGDVVYDKEGIYGDCVNLASRIESLSVPGAVLFSGKVYDEIKNQRDIQTHSLGKFHFKNVKKPLEVYAAANDGMVIPSPAHITGKLSQDSFSLSSMLKKRKVRWIVLVVLAAFITLAIALFYLTTGKSSSVIDSIAVLPLENLSGNTEQEYFVSGMHETLISELSKISSLKVISRTSTLQYKDTKKTMPEIAKELDVKAIIEGSVIREGDIVRITVQLIDGTTDKHLWAEKFDRELRGILALHSEVAQKIAEAIKLELTPQDKIRLVSTKAINPRAYEFYLTGRHYWNQRTINSYKQAIENFKKAIEEDSSYAQAYAALADCYILLGEQGGMPQQEAGLQANNSIQKALLLNDKLAEAYSSLGVWKLSYEWNWAESEKAFKKAIDLNPGYAITYQWYGRTLGFIGRYDEAIKLLEKAKELDPLSPVIVAYIGQVQIYAKQYNKAEVVLHDALKVHPNHPLILHNIGELYAAQGRYTEAIAPLKQSSELSASAHYKAILAYAYAMVNRKDEVMAILKELLNRSDSGSFSGFNMAAVYLALGDTEKALSQLQKGYEQRDVWMKELKAWPWFDTLKNEPRYKDLIKRMNFPE
ncbi:MAG TPA: tetratricopeptide repeat protein [Chitinophagaceae bacterium]|nr:tetratricopeptide repeat protein [Chitinophagaceae bacterium]